MDILEQTLDAVIRRFDDLNHEMSDPVVASDHTRIQKLAREHSELEPVVHTYAELKKVRQTALDAESMLSEQGLDAELKDLAQLEIRESKEREQTLLAELQVMLLPKDPNDAKDVFLEVRAGTGGEEAALFAAELLRMYVRYAEKRGWRTELMSETEASAGGIKEAVVSIQGAGAYSFLKYESGVHRVQRVPVTETGGRIHTSAATVAVLPEAEEVDVHIDTKDLQIDTFRASSAGGQHVNKTDSAIRITHIPSGVVVSCQDERSQLQNKEKAMRMLRAHLLEAKQREQADAVASSRKEQVGSGDRSEKIRTYNFPQGRITDHRIGLTIYSLDTFMEGELDDMINALIRHNQKQLLEQNSTA